MVITDLRSQLTRCTMCAWYNEWHRFGERDQLSLSYVLHAMGLTPDVDSAGTPPTAAGLVREGRLPHPASHRGVYLWPRSEHWHAKLKRAAGKPKAKPYVRYVGHGSPDQPPQRARVAGSARQL